MSLFASYNNNIRSAYKLTLEVNGLVTGTTCNLNDFNSTVCKYETLTLLCTTYITCLKSHLFDTEEEGSGENSWTQDVVFVFTDSDGKIVGMKVKTFFR